MRDLVLVTPNGDIDEQAYAVVRKTQGLRGQGLKVVTAEDTRSEDLGARIATEMGLVRMSPSTISPTYVADQLERMGQGWDVLVAVVDHPTFAGIADFYAKKRFTGAYPLAEASEHGTKIIHYDLANNTFHI